MPSALTSLGTCFSVACVSINIESTKQMGVPSDIAEATISLGTRFHKDGLAIVSVFEIMFLVCFFGTSLNNLGNIGEILGVSLIATLLVTAVPIGGGTISEMLILTLMGYPIATLPILTIVATVIDVSATFLNVVRFFLCFVGYSFSRREKRIESQKSLTFFLFSFSIYGTEVIA